MTWLSDMSFPKNYDQREFMDPARVIMGDGFSHERDTLEHLGRHETHASLIFPESTGATVTLSSHASADTWSSWIEIQDSAAVKLTSKITSNTHICAVAVESTSAADQIWMVEIAYGDDKTTTAMVRFVSQSIGMLELVQFFRIRSRHIPIGETVYYRLMCSSGTQTCQVHFRYFFVD